jgi:hypothetical protein
MYKVLGFLFLSVLIFSGYYFYLEPKINYENLLTNLQKENNPDLFFEDINKYKYLSDTQKLTILKEICELINQDSVSGNLSAELNRILNNRNKLNDNISYFLAVEPKNHLQIVKILAENGLLEVYEKNQSLFVGIYSSDYNESFNNLKLIASYYYSIRVNSNTQTLNLNSDDYIRAGINNFKLNNQQKYSIYRDLYGDYSTDQDLINYPLALKLLDQKTQIEYIYNNNDPYQIYINFDKFDIDPSMHLEIFKYLISKFTDSSYLANYFEKFYGIPEDKHYELAIFLIENENPSFVGDNIQKFKGIRKDQHTDIVNRILDAYNSYYSASLARNIENFNGLDSESKFKIAARIINRDKSDWRSGRNEDLASNLYKFKLSNSQTLGILKELSLLGFKENILKNIVFYPEEIVDSIRNLPTN